MSLIPALRHGTCRTLRQRLALLLLATLVHAGYAFAAHVHPLAPESGDQREFCGACLHAERLGPPPVFVAPAPFPAPAVLVSTTLDLPVVSAAPRHSYRSRAPPALTP
ncbi:MAG: hypothetical protein FJ197_11935 [Gammaproteobacteria bacterium]|nr:hypothetical protein [Gammaproteobacteria bacterium]